MLRQSKFQSPNRWLRQLMPALCCILVTAGGAGAQSQSADGTAPLDVLRQARQAVKSSPDDPKARFQLAELLRKSGRQREAAQEYLESTELDPSLYLAYHQLTVVNADEGQLDEAIEKLLKLKEDKPKELMLRVALSELYEKRDNFYQAARVLIDIMYDDSIPLKHKTRVNARIHYLLTKAHDLHLTETADGGNNGDDLDVVPSPLPESSLRKGLIGSKVKESQMKGMGHVPLLP